MNFRKIRKFRINVRAISPIIATLLLIAIAVVAALVTYAWVMGYIGFQTGNVGKSVQITSVSDNGNPDVAGGEPPTYIIVYVQSSGSPGSSVSFNAVSGYVNGTIWTTAQQLSTFTPAIGAAPASVTTPVSTSFTPVSSGSTAMITLYNAGGTLSSGEQVTIKITTTSGTYSQVTTNLP